MNQTVSKLSFLQTSMFIHKALATFEPQNLKKYAVVEQLG